MRKFFLFLFFPLILIYYSCKNYTGDEEINSSEVVETSGDENIPEVIRNLPVAIEVRHEPDTIYAKIHDVDSSKYKWSHYTSVKALNSNIQIIEFGTYNYKNNEWVLGNLSSKPYKAKEFEKWYFKKTSDSFVSWENCKGAYLIKDQEYVDPSNWSISNTELVERKGLWYYIGIDDSGKKVCGYGRYVTIPELSDNK
ncbi:MAG: hypothetical protein ABIJ97_09940 [Bacteroidota bacterium]